MSTHMLCLLLSLAPKSVSPQTPPQVDPGGPKLPPYDFAWTKEEWTADETPYLAIRKEVEAYTKGRRVSQTKTDLLERTQSVVTSAIANKRNPVTLYRAAYYEYMLAGLDYSMRRGNQEVNDGLRREAPVEGLDLRLP